MWYNFPPYFKLLPAKHLTSAPDREYLIWCRPEGLDQQYNLSAIYVLFSQGQEKHCKSREQVVVFIHLPCRKQTKNMFDTKDLEQHGFCFRLMRISFAREEERAKTDGAMVDTVAPQGCNEKIVFF